MQHGGSKIYWILSIFCIHNSNVSVRCIYQWSGDHISWKSHSGEAFSGLLTDGGRHLSLSVTHILQCHTYPTFPRKTYFIEWYSWFKFNNLGLTRYGTVLQVYKSVARTLKLKIRKIWELIPTSVGSYKGRTG